ncbi:SLC13 family permease [Leucobacter sp. HY1908]
MLLTAAGWARQHAVFSLTAVLAAISMALVPPSRAYLDYFDVRALALLGSTLAVMSALQSGGFFQALAERVAARFRSLRAMVAALVFATAGASALFTNDVALLAFLPLAYLALDAAGANRMVAYTFVLMTAGANLGGMITPFGSPQNLFLFSHFSIPGPEFLAIMLGPFVCSMVMIALLCLLVPAHPVPRASRPPLRVTKWAVEYLLLFGLTAAVVLRALPLWAVLAVPLVLLLRNRRARARLDWPLLGTFVAFFVLAGTLARTPAAVTLVETLLSHGVLLWSALLSQVISNVPAALLLAPFTDQYAGLLIGVNIGGVGTLVGSLASLIALSQFCAVQPEGTGHFLRVFGKVNVGLLTVLLGGALLFSE